MSGTGIMAGRDRKPLFFVLLVTLALMALTFAPAYAAADSTVHGSVYDWSTFSTVDNAIVKVYSLPGLILQGQAVMNQAAIHSACPKATICW